MDRNTAHAHVRGHRLTKSVQARGQKRLYTCGYKAHDYIPREQDGNEITSVAMTGQSKNMKRLSLHSSIPKGAYSYAVWFVPGSACSTNNSSPAMGSDEGTQYDKQTRIREIAAAYQLINQDLAHRIYRVGFGMRLQTKTNDCRHFQDEILR